MVEVTHTLSDIWFLQISSQLLSRYNKLGVYRRGWLRSILFDRTSILFVEQAVYRPSTPCLVALSTFACKMQDVVWSDQALNVLEEIVRKQYIVLWWRINGIASWMTLKSSKVKNFSWRIGTILILFSCCLRLLPSCSSIHHQTNIESTQICSEDHLSVSRIRSHHLLLEVVLRVEEECLFFLPLGMLDRIELLVQYQSKFFHEQVQSLKMSKQLKVYLVLL